MIAARSRIGLAAAACVATAAGLCGCSPYIVQGKVIEGDVSYIAVVDASDARLQGRGLSGASVEIWTDPEKLNRRRVATNVSDSDGSFSLPFGETGAGVLDYEVSVLARREGYSGAEIITPLPSSSKRLLIMMKPGASRLPKETETLMEQYRRFSR